jgi:Putative Ig domain
MALNVWTESSGYSFGTHQEREIVSIALPISINSGITYSIISGELPPGLIIQGNNIVGTPYEVPRLTNFTFCIRASNGTSISDRTFNMSINNSDGPVFVTAAGNLPLGPAQQLFALADTYIDFQIDVFDYTIVTGKKLTFFISDNNGVLPPGLVLTTDGRIVGFVQPVLSILPQDGNGYYDTGPFDNIAYDFGYRPNNGFDSFIYDSVDYDFYISSNTPRQLNRNYQFIISVTDGDNVASREFDIFVVGDDYFKADNNTLLDGSGLFTADTTYLTAPVWITQSSLGTLRANNYTIIPVNLYDTENVFCALQSVNANITAVTSKIAAYDNVIGSYHLTIEATTAPIVGYYLTFDGLVNGATSLIHQITAVSLISAGTYRLTLNTQLEVTIPDDIIFLIGTLSALPPGLSFDVEDNEIFGYIPYQPAITQTYNFTITATRYSTGTEVSKSSRMFTINVIGEIDSVITWDTDSDLGSINANYVSTLKISAKTSIPNAVVIYTLTDGMLPSGLTLNLDGEIIGKVNQFYNNSMSGLTLFDFTLDNSTTTIDRMFTFTVLATTLFGYGATTKTFTIEVSTPDEVSYSNISVRPYLKLSQRSLWKDFINDPSVFTPSSIYRSNDPNFGIQKTLSMLIFAGIETTTAAAYVGAIGLNHKKKRFQFGPVKKAIAYNPGTTDEVYEVVYMSMIDPLESNGNYLPNKLTNLSGEHPAITVDESTSIWSRSLSDLSIHAPTATRPDPMITIDSTGYTTSDPNATTYYPSSISNWRQRIEAIGMTERNYLPLWMRSIQPGSKQQLDFQLAVPLCYCKSGTADTIILNIKYSGFNFSLLDYTIDRYIIDAVEGSVADKYLVFRNDRITV